MEASRAVFLVDLLEIEEADDRFFIVEWERARDFLQSKRGFLANALYRSLRPEARFRFVNVAAVESVDTWRHLIGDPAYPGPEMPRADHPGLYEILHEDKGSIGPGVVLVNAFDVPAEADESSFIDPWRRVHDFMVRREGHRGARLLRRVGPADFRFVTIALWESEQAFVDAIQDPVFGEVVADMPYEAHTGVYELIRR